MFYEIMDTSSDPTLGCVVDPRFVTRGARDITVVQDSHGLTAVDNGKLVFKIDVPSFPVSLSGRRQLRDSANVPILSIKRERWPMGTWSIRRGAADNAPVLATVKSIRFKKVPTYNVYLGSSTDPEAFQYQALGNICPANKVLDIFHKLPGQDLRVARFERRPAEIKGLSESTPPAVYNVHVMEDVDASFIITLVGLVVTDMSVATPPPASCVVPVVKHM